VLTVTRDMVLPTTITGSYPRPLWFDRSLAGRSFKSALGDSLFREQYLDAVASIIAEQEAAGLDIVTDGDSRFDLTVGGKSWFFYPIERLGGVCDHRDTSRGWMSRHGLRPGKILWEVQEAYQPGVVRERLTRGPLEYAALWQVAQRMTDRPVKFGAICAPALASMLWNEYYDDDKAMVFDLCEIINAEFRDMAAAGCPLIQVEEPPHHMRAQQPDCTDADLEKTISRHTTAFCGSLGVASVGSKNCRSFDRILPASTMPPYWPVTLSHGKVEPTAESQMKPCSLLHASSRRFRRPAGARRRAVRARPAAPALRAATLPHRRARR